MNGIFMSIEARVQKLHEQHTQLETRIRNEVKRPNPDQLMLSELKVKKLRIKEEMERLKA